MNSRTLVGLLGVALIMGAASAQSTQAVEWKASEGGNGHWYSIPSETGVWNSMRDWSQAKGGHLATVATLSEWQWLKTHLSVVGCFMGGYQDHSDPTYAEPAGGWRWVTGEPFVFSLAYMSFDDCPGGRPGSCGCGTPGAQDVLMCFPDWLDDVGDGVISNCDSDARRAVVEWDADCNGDGIVDYGQILRGELDDDNANGVPDICEPSVTGVIPPSVPSQGGSTVTIKGANFPVNLSVAIGGVPATDVVRVSATRITATCPALLPGMVSVTVNGFTLQEALYIRPNCGSDLDQDGEVTAADIAIVLLDFGPCYVSAAPNPPEDSRPFMLREEAAAAVLQSR
jgi:hypothetical protein